MSDEHSDEKPPSPWWRHVTILVAIFGFSVLSFVTVRTYRDAPPIPGRVVDAGGTVLFGKEDILRGQEVFLQHGLMEHGSLFGHGAYLGPDYGAEYLHRLAEITHETLARGRHGKAFPDLPSDASNAIARETEVVLRKNRFVPATDTLTFTEGETASFAEQKREWREYFGSGTAPPGLAARSIPDEADTDALTAYFAWTAWVSVAPRPGLPDSYTNNWPYEPLVGNRPGTAAYFWSAMSLVTLLGGLGAVLLAFGKFDYLGWKSPSGPGHAHENRLLGRTLTPSQRAVAPFLGVVALLFLAQTLVGGALAHYRVEPGAFYGIDIAAWFPYNLARTWHLQLAIFWIATAWVAGGLFLAPAVGGIEPKGQRAGALVLLAALTLVVVGSLFGEMLGLRGTLGKAWFWLGHQGSEYLDLGRLWQILLAAGLVLWLVLMFRALRPAMKDPRRGQLASLFLYAAVAIPVFYLPALFYGPRDNFAVIDNWRFWIIHLWVEGFFELFATVLVAVMFNQMGLVSLTTATRLVYLDAILYLGAGIIGTGHHWYFTGQGTLNMALASCFSAMEVVPLTLLTLDAWDFVRLKDRTCGDCGKSLAAGQGWAIKFLMAVGFWNFVGAGVFGFLINLPIVSYFEVGTALTTNHGHAAMFGVFGMLALGVLVFCLRWLSDDGTWDRAQKLVRVGFWGLNIGLALMIVIDLFPAGVLQLWDSLENGYWHARRLTYTMSGTFHALEWARIGADTVFLVLGVVPVVAATLLVVLRRRPRTLPVVQETPPVNP